MIIMPVLELFQMRSMKETLLSKNCRLIKDKQNRKISLLDTFEISKYIRNALGQLAIIYKAPG